MQKLTEYDLNTQYDDIFDDDVLYTDRVIVQPIKSPEKTTGGIILTSQARNDQDILNHLGRIIKKGAYAFKNSAGESVYKPEPEVGDIVMYGKFAGTGIPREVIDGDGKLKTIKYLMIRDSDIAMKVKNPAGYITYK